MFIVIDETYTLTEEQILALEKFIRVYANFPDNTHYELYSYHKAIVYKGLKLISEKIFSKNYKSIDVIQKICEQR